MTHFRKRLKSKTYLVAIVGAVITGIEASSGFVSDFLPAAVRPYLVLVWPLLMLGMREFTTSAIAEK